VAIVTIHYAKTNLSRLLARVEAGEEIIVARARLPVARLVPCPKSAPRRAFGAFKGVVTVGPGFFDPPPSDEPNAWER
jgi:prevent-host-death family protein